ncbi:transposase [Chryseobacterium glaciei]|uniref:Transposase n=1 Tax=Chryseobacterium glaciei TaxID=1685010 RepID=A0A172XS98_9FLAO|nr:transposase [Chryseobacterium glaciei]ANF49796.1 transposase [Chryseobacterium glaciei]
MKSFKNIDVGNLIRQRVTESEIEIPRVCNFFSCTEEEIEEMYESKSLEADTILKWSKLLEYDFFRIYSQHLILFSPPSNAYSADREKTSALPQFRKNIYTKEVIDFLVELIQSGEKNMNEIIDQYGIPKTTLHRWTVKYRNHELEKKNKNTS